MTKWLLAAGWFLIAVSGVSAGPGDPGFDKKNIEYIRLVVIPQVHTSQDSIQLHVFLDVPNFSVQFVKKKAKYRAEFEAIVSVRTKAGRQIGRNVWNEYIEVQDYRETTSNMLHRSLYSQYGVGAGDYVVVGEIMDKDTKNTAQKERDLDLSEYTTDLVLFPIVALKVRPGVWGFGEGWAPVMDKTLYPADSTYQILVSGNKQPGPATVTYEALDKARNILWTTAETLDSSVVTFTTRTDLPTELFKALRFSLEVRLQQSGRFSHRTLSLTVSHPGISGMIHDIDEALDQCRYILTSAERKQLKRAGRKEREVLFRKFWSDRDPTPNTARNELMDEYYSRVQYANQRFTSFIPGWRTDMGMIYILFGAPDDIERQVSSRSRNAIQTWYYYHLNRSFTFLDESGFGDYRLTTPYFGAGNW